MPRRQFMVRDVGSSLGHSRQFRLFAMLGTRGAQGSKNDVDDFEQQGFIEKVEGNKVRFDYRGMNQALVDTRDRARRDLGVRAARARFPTDTGKRRSRPAAYPPAHADRYIRKIKEKIAQGLALKSDGYALDAGRCSFSSTTRSRCASTASGSSCSAA